MIMVATSIYDGVLVLSLLIIANAHQCGGVCQDGARTIGSNNRIQYEAEERSRGRLYLNIENPAQCNGTITSWEYCCYLPQNRGVYQVYFAIYRRREVGHGKQKNIQYQNQNQILNLSVDHDDMDGGFVCNSFVPTEHISVQQGDIIGICLPGTNSLDIVSNTSTCDRTRSHTNSERSCTSTNSQRSPTNSTLLYLNREVHCSNTGIPGTINVNQHNKIIEFQGNRIAHLYAQINTNTGETIPIQHTNSESESPTTPIVPDRPQTESDSNISTSTPSQFSITSDFIGGQPSTSMVVPIAVTSTGAITNSHSAIATYVENSASVHTPVTSIGLMASTIDSILIVTSTREPGLMTTSLATTPGSGSQNLEQGSLNTAVTVIIILIVIAFMVLTAALVGILVRKYKKRRFRFYPAFKHTVLEEDENSYSQAGTIARFDNVLYSNYTETVQIQDTRKTGQVYDFCNSSQKSSDHEQQPIESIYSELQEELDSESYSYAIISGKYDTPTAVVDSRLPVQRPYDPNRESLLSTYCAPASKESDLYAQLKLCGVKNIRRDTIEATEQLGSGQFGDVKMGIWRNEKLKVPVALKTLKEGSEQSDKVKFLQEAAIMAQFSHPNVAVLYGVVSKGEPIMLVVELVEKGNLFDYLAFLKENNDSVHLPNLPNILLNFSRQVALGMCYLSERGFVHRDLAARNILVSSDDICKIADFGMSRDLADENYYVSHGGKIPVKWTAPEAINYKKYSTASDVWSYGCLLYEIWSLGHKPYENLSNLQVIRNLDLGQRLSPPPGCPRKIYELMIFCWNPEVAFRPKFSSLALILIGDWKEVLAIPQDELVTHQLAGVLGAPLEAGEGLYLDLQNRYVFN